MSARAKKHPLSLPVPVLHADGSLTICLPVPARACSPNASRGQSKAAAIGKSKKVKAHRWLAEAIMHNALVRGFAPPRPVFTGYSLAHFFRTAAFRDDDNADGACKAYRDGIASALGVDDRTLRKCRLSIIAKDAKCPRVEVTLYPADLQSGVVASPT